MNKIKTFIYTLALLIVFHADVQSQSLTSCISNDDVQCLKNYIDVKKIKDDDVASIVQKSVLYNSTNVLKFALTHFNKDVLQAGFYINRMTPLYMAVHQENLDALKIILAYGGNPNYGCGKFATALFPAVQSSNYEIIKILLRNGADPNCFYHRDGAMTISTVESLLNQKQGGKIYDALQNAGLIFNLRQEMELLFNLPISNYSKKDLSGHWRLFLDKHEGDIGYHVIVYSKDQQDRREFEGDEVIFTKIRNLLEEANVRNIIAFQTERPGDSDIMMLNKIFQDLNIISALHQIPCTIDFRQ